MRTRKMDPDFLVIDLFCGGGGTTTGFEKATIAGRKIAKVIACVNHDDIAIQSHAANHKSVLHFTEDIRTLNLEPLLRHIERMQRRYPRAKIVVWASLECTNFSKAKGGLPRDADSRTLAEHLYRYIETICPDYLMIENVEEFMSWGPLTGKVIKSEDGYLCCKVDFKIITRESDELIEVPVVMNDPKYGTKTIRKLVPEGIKVLWHAVPESKQKGEDFIRWRDHVKSYGYEYDHRLLNSADFGAFTSRTRYFAIFAKYGLPIVWPEPTHAKNPNKQGLFRTGLRKWKAVRKVLDLHDEGVNIFERKKPLSEKTLQRILAGLIKYVAGGKDAWLLKYYSSHNNTTVNAGSSLDDPLSTVTTFGGGAIVKPTFLMKMNSSSHPGSMCTDPNVPAGTLTTKCHQAVVQASFAFMHQRNSGNPNSKVFDLDRPARTITGTGGNQDVVQCQPVDGTFMMKYLSNNPKTGVNSGADINQPCPTVTTQNRLALVSWSEFQKSNAEKSTDDKKQYWLDVQHSMGKRDESIESPAGSLTTVPKRNLVTAKWLDKQYSGAANHQSVERPAGTVLTNDKHVLMSAAFLQNHNYDNTGTSIENPAPTLLASRRHYYIINPSWAGGKNGASIKSVEDPAPTIVARQDKAPLYLAMTESGEAAIVVYETDSPATIEIKKFMALYGIASITMRMLKVVELKRIMGVKDDYELKGNQGKQKWMIGNMVHPECPRNMARAVSRALRANERTMAA